MNQALFVFYALTVIALFCAFYLIPTFLRWKAANSLTSGDGDKAIDAFSKALKMSPRDAKIWFGLAVGLRRLKRWDESLLALDAVQRLSPFKTPVLIERISVLRAQKRLDEALKETTFWIEHEGCPDEVRLARSAIEIELQRFSEAEKDCNYLIDRGTESICAEAFSNRGLARLMLGRVADAEADFETSYLLDPRSSEARAYCASFWLRRNMPQKTLALCEATIKTDGTCAAAYYFSGLAKQALGDSKGADEYLKRATEMKYGLAIAPERLAAFQDSE